MAQLNQNNSERLFENEYLEMLTKSHPLIIDAMYAIIITAAVWYGTVTTELPTWGMIALFLIGSLGWTFFEYLLHRYLFHYTGPIKLLQKAHYYFHEIHHKQPKDKNRLVMPPVPSLLFAGVFFLLFFIAAGEGVFFLWSGFILGYLIYSTIHYLIHLDNSPDFLEKQKLYHNIHHYQQPNRAYGVTTSLWDRVFGTLPIIKKGKTQR